MPRRDESDSCGSCCFWLIFSLAMIMMMSFHEAQERRLDFLEEQQKVLSTKIDHIFNRTEVLIMSINITDTKEGYTNASALKLALGNQLVNHMAVQSPNVNYSGANSIANGKVKMRPPLQIFGIYILAIVVSLLILLVSVVALACLCWLCAVICGCN